MRALEEKIIKEGKVLDGHVLKVGAFLNQQIDTSFTSEMADEVIRLYKDCEITKVLTVEASGIAIAFAIAEKLGVPVVFAKKGHSSNQSGSLLTAKVHSYTKGIDYIITVAREYISEDEKVLVVDDFLANGQALCGLIDIVKTAGADVVGCAVQIEKGFQGGGDRLRDAGIRVESLAIIDSMSDDGIVFRS